MSTEFVTHDEFELAMARIDARFDRFEANMDARFDRSQANMNARFDRFEANMNARFANVDSRFAVTEARLEAKIEAATVTSIRWTVGMAFGLYALMFGLILFVISRELPHA